jgi:hexosaminidase
MHRISTIALASVAIFIGSLTVAIPSQAEVHADPNPAVVPRLTSWAAQSGSTTLTSRSRIVVDPRAVPLTTTPAGRAELPGPARQTGWALAERLRADLAAVTGLTLPVVSGREARTGDLALRLTDDRELGAEGYRLDTTGAVRIEAASTHGLFYGTRTVLQLLTTTSTGHRELPRGTTTDRPTQRVRMVMLDAARKYWQPAYLENVIRRMGHLKLNTLFLHLSDAEGFRLNSPKFPGLAHQGSSYTRADIERLKKVAARNHVQLMPGIDVPGHATVLSNVFGIGFGTGPNPCGDAHTHSHLTPDWIIDLTSPRTIDISRKIVDEFVGWFDAPLFSLGADELPGQLANCPRVQQYLAADPGSSTLGDLLNRYINTLDDVVTKRGKRTAIYNGSEHMAAPQHTVHDDVVFLTWEGTGTEPVIDNHDEIAIGPFYVTPNNYHSLYPDEPWMYDEWVPNTAPDMLGSGLMNWGDYVYWADDEYFERLMATPRAIMADRSWNGSTTPDAVADFRARMTAIGDPPGVTPAPTRPRVHGKPSHRYTFEPADYPIGWTYASRPPDNTLLVDDEAGALPGTTYIINNPTRVPDGIRGNAFRFDSGRDGVGFGGIDVAPPWTAAVWVRRNQLTTDGPLLTSKAGALKLDQYNSCGKVGFTRNGVADHSFDYSAPANEWVHLAFVATPTGATLYVNGQPRGTVPATIDLPMRSIGDVRRMALADLDELVTYDEALTQQQVSALYAGYGVTGSDKQYDCPD